MTKKNPRKIFNLFNLYNLLFAAIFLLFLLAGLVKTLFFPIEINLYENRTADKVEAPTLAGYLSSDFQSSMEKGLADQVLFAEEMKKSYNDTNSTLLHQMMMSVIENTKGRYISYLGSNIFNGDYLLRDPVKYDGHGEDWFDSNLQSYNRGFAENSDTEFFMYYIETERDVNFESGERSGAYELLLETLNLPSGHLRRLELQNFDDYKRYFMKTDHHWNYQGSYQGYVDILKMLAPEETPLAPLETVVLGESSGSMAAGNGIAGFFEDFTVYRFDFPKMEITIEGKPAQDYGKQTEYLHRRAEEGLLSREENVRYGDFYGWDDAEIIFDTGNREKENLLILGDSFDNAILKLVASHFGRTYSVDLRHYKRYQGEAFDLAKYIREHQIDKVLFEGYEISLTLKDFGLGG